VENEINSSKIKEVNQSGSLLLFWYLFFVLAYLPSLLAGFAPSGEKPVHQGVETGIVTRFQQVTHLVDDHMLHTPIGQQ
jgi:hypothetical protein